MHYGLPIPPGHRFYAKAVMYNPGFVKGSAYVEPELTTQHWLIDAGASRVCVGHMPRGQCPAVIRTEDDALLVTLADTSYSDVKADRSIGIADMRGQARAMVCPTARTTEVRGVLADGSCVGTRTPRWAPSRRAGT